MEPRIHSRIFVIILEIFTLLVLLQSYTQAYLKNEEKITITANRGENVILPCTIDYPNGGPVAYIVQWKKRGIRAPIFMWYEGFPTHYGKNYSNKISLIEEASLNVTDIQETDQGWYECKIVNLNIKDSASENGTWIYLEVRAPPRFEIKPPDIEYVKLGRSVFIQCKAAGTPSPAVEWYKEKQKLKSRGRVEITRKGLRISRIEESDAGNYMCAATNREGRAETHFVILTAGGAVITVPPQNKTVTEPGKVEIICDAKAIPSNITYRWYKDGKDITKIQWQNSRSRIREHDGALVIYPSDADDTGTYKCEVTNGIGAPKTAQAYLNIEYPAEVIHHPKQQFLPNGLPGKLKCHFKANPPVKLVKWKKNGVTVNFSDVVSQKKEIGTLFFKTVRREHAGRYTCTPCNVLGCAGDSEVMQIYVRDPPVFTVRPAPDYQKVVNGEVTLVCKGDGQPRPKVIWRRADGNPLPAARTILKGGTLTIKGLKKEDYGTYECIIKNEVATILSSSRLIVEAGPSRRSIQNDYYDTSPHAPTNLTVTTKIFSAKLSWFPAYDGGHMQSYIAWYKDEGSRGWKQIPVPNQRNEIELFKLKQYAKYLFKVQAENKRGKSLFSQTVAASTKSVSEHDVVLPTEMVLSYNSTSSVSHFPRPRNLTAKIQETGGIIFTWLPPENPTVPVLHYSFEFSRKPSGSWNKLNDKIPSINNTFFLPEIEVGRRYYFRVIAIYKDMQSPGKTLKFEIPAKKKTEKDQAITAGVIGGILFFIVAMVLSICVIKICNKRRRRKAEKAYMMVTGPVVETRNGGQSQAPSPVPLKKRRKGTNDWNESL